MSSERVATSPRPKGSLSYVGDQGVADHPTADHARGRHDPRHGCRRHGNKAHYETDFKIKNRRSARRRKAKDAFREDGIAFVAIHLASSPYIDLTPADRITV